MPSLLETAPAKINLALRVIGRRADGYHELESLVAFADLADKLTLTPGKDTALEIGGPFGSGCGAASDNLVLKAAAAAGLPAGLFSLEKNIPVSAGLGGGSADAAAALRLIARANNLSLRDSRMLAAARAVGADVPVCLEARARIMRGIGDRLSAPVTLPRLPAVLVNPRVPLPTAQVFAGFVPQDAGPESLGEVPQEVEALFVWLGARANDLTRAANLRVPVIAGVLEALGAAPGCRLARMSGSGATCFGLFSTQDAAQSAAEAMARHHADWWICPTVLVG